MALGSLGTASPRSVGGGRPVPSSKTSAGPDPWRRPFPVPDGFLGSEPGGEISWKLKIFAAKPMPLVKASLAEDPVRAPMRQMRVEDPETARVLLHPARSRILAKLRVPASATEVARALGEPPARVNHHVRRLRDAGLVSRAGTRRIKNLTEVLYVAMARTFVIAEGVTPGGEERRRSRGTTKQRTLQNLVLLGERLAADSLALLDEAVNDSREVSAYATSVDLRFADATARAAFLTDLLEAVGSLKRKYGVSIPDEAGGRYRAVIACYPEAGGPG